MQVSLRLHKLLKKVHFTLQNRNCGKCFQITFYLTKENLKTCGIKIFFKVFFYSKTLETITFLNISFNALITSDTLLFVCCLTNIGRCFYAIYMFTAIRQVERCTSEQMSCVYVDSASDNVSNKILLCKVQKVD